MSAELTIIPPRVLDAINRYRAKWSKAPAQGRYDIERALSDRDPVWEGERSHRRHWADVFRVVEIEGVLIGYGAAETTGDDSPHDKGWELELDTICEVAPVTKLVEVTTYEPISKEAST